MNANLLMLLASFLINSLIITSHVQASPTSNWIQIPSISHGKIQLLRTHEQALFEKKFDNISQLTDSFRIFPIRLIQSAQIQVQLLDIQQQQIATLIPTTSVTAGDSYFIITYEDVHSYLNNNTRFHLKILASTENETKSWLLQGLLRQNKSGIALHQAYFQDVLLQDYALNFTETGINYQGRGPDITLNAFYDNTPNVFNDFSTLGKNWGHSLGQRLRVIADNPQDFNLPTIIQQSRGKILALSHLRTPPMPYPKITLLQIAGIGHFYRDNERWQASRGVYDQLQETKTQFIVRSPQGEVRIFNKNLPTLLPTDIDIFSSAYNQLQATYPLAYQFGRPIPQPIQSIQDRHHNTLTFEYHPQWPRLILTKVIDAVQRKLYFHYAFQHQAAQLDGFQDNTTSGFSSLLSYLINPAPALAPPRLILVSQDSAPDLHLQYNPKTLMLSRFGNQSLSTKYQYQAIDAPLQTNWEWTQQYQLQQRKNTQQTIQYQYHPPETLPIWMRSSLINTNNCLASLQINNTLATDFILPTKPHHRLIKQGDQTWPYLLNQYGNPIQFLDNEQHTINLRWSIDENLPGYDKIASISNQHTHYYHYDRGNLIQEGDNHYTWSKDYNLLLTQTLASGDSYRYVYDSQGNLIQQFENKRLVATHEYNQYGERIASQTPEGKTTFTYDHQGNPIPNQAYKLDTVDDHYTFKSLNFQFNRPALPTIIVDPKTINKEASLAFYNKQENLTFFIIAEKMGIDQNFTQQELIDHVKHNLAKSLKKHHIVSESPKTINNLPGYQIITQDSNALWTTNYIHWVLYYHGYVYQLVVIDHAPQSDFSQLSKQAQDYFSLFQIIDNKKYYYTDQVTAYTKFSSPQFGYHIDLTATPWVTWEKRHNTYPEAETAGRFSQSGYFAFIPFCYGKYEPNIKALQHAFLQSLSIDTNDQRLIINQSKQTTIDIDYDAHFQRNIDDAPLYYRFNIFKTAECAYFLVVWSAKSQQIVDQLYQSVIHHIDIAANHPMPKTPSLQTERSKTQAYFFNQLALFYYKAKIYTKSIQLLLQAIAFNNDQEVYLSNALDVYAKLSQYDEALSTLTPYLKQHQQNHKILSWWAWYLYKSNDLPNSIKKYKLLFAKDYTNDEDFSYYMQALAQTNQWSALIQATHQYFQHSHNVANLKVKQAKLYNKYKKYQQAIDILLPLLNKTFDANIVFLLIKNYFQIKAYPKILDLTIELIAHGYESNETYYQMGRAHFLLKQYTDAKYSFEKALDKNPDDTNAQAYIKHISGLLGQGENSIIKDFIKAVPLPASLQKQIKQIKIPNNHKKYSAIYQYKIKGIEYIKDDLSKTTTYYSVILNDWNGVQQFSTLNINFNALSDKVFVNKLHIYDQQNQLINQGQRKDYYIIDKQENDFADYKKTLNIPVPGLAPGYRIEFVSTIQQQGKPKSFGFKKHYLSSTYPIQLSAVFVTGDVQSLKYHQQYLSEPEISKNLLIWTQANPTIYRWENEQPPTASYLPTIWLADQSPQWQTLTQDYLKDISPKLKLDPQIKQLAQQLTQQHLTLNAKINTLIAYVQHQYVYKPIEFGLRGIIPHTAKQTLANKYGDCKDHSVLLQQLLTAIDVPAYLALVNISSPIKMDMPNLSQFDHMIVYIDKIADIPARFVDPTDKEIDAQQSAPLGLANKQALVLNTQPQFIKIPAYATEQHHIHIGRNITLSNQQLKVNETARFSGYPAKIMRDLFNTLSPLEFHQRGQKLLQRYLPSITLEKISLKHLYNSEQPFSISLIYTVNHHITAFDNLLLIHSLPIALEHYFLQADALTQRITPLNLAYPLKLNSQTKIKLPPSYQLRSMPTEQQQSSLFGQWQLTYTHTATSYTQTFQYQRSPAQYPANDYSTYYDFIHNMLSQIASSIILNNAHQKTLTLTVEDFPITFCN